MSSAETGVQQDHLAGVLAALNLVSSDPLAHRQLWSVLVRSGWLPPVGSGEDPLLMRWLVRDGTLDRPVGKFADYEDVIAVSSFIRSMGHIVSVSQDRL